MKSSTYEPGLRITDGDLEGDSSNRSLIVLLFPSGTRVHLSISYHVPCGLELRWNVIKIKVSCITSTTTATVEVTKPVDTALLLAKEKRRPQEGSRALASRRVDFLSDSFEMLLAVSFWIPIINKYVKIMTKRQKDKVPHNRFSSHVAAQYVMS